MSHATARAASTFERLCGPYVVQMFVANFFRLRQLEVSTSHLPKHPPLKPDLNT